MKKLLLLCAFTSLAICESLEELQEASFDYDMQSNEWILEIFIVIIGLLSVFFLFSFLHINRYTKKNYNVKELVKHRKIDTMITERSRHEIDICSALNLYFSLIHSKASEKNNAVCLIFNPKTPRNIQINHTYTCPIFFALIEFMLGEISGATITADVTHLKIDENSVKYRFLARANKLLPDLQNGLLIKILKNKEKLLRYKKLNFVLKISAQLGIDIEFKNMQNHSEFSFTQTFDLAKNIKAVRLPKFKKQKAVILEYNKKFYYMVFC